MGSRAIGIENTCHFDRQMVLPPIIKKQRFGTALTLVIAGPQPDRVHIAPIALGLRMNTWITIDLTRRGLEYLYLEALSEPEHVDRPKNARFGRLHWILLVMNRRCRTRQIENFVNLYEKRMSDVVTQQFKVCVFEKVLDIVPRPCEEIIDAQDLASSAQKSLTKMRAEETGTT
jgi:hypothetical protein